MIYSHEVQQMCVVKKGPNHGPAPIPEEGKWVKAKQISDISGLTHGVGWCAPQQGACKLTLNVKDGIIEEALVETWVVSYDSLAAMAAEILPGKTLLEALNTDLYVMPSIPPCGAFPADCIRSYAKRFLRRRLP
jgi:NifU-like protein involved in Fe-S cluster formation